jgi:hypothetical protein
MVELGVYTPNEGKSKPENAASEEANEGNSKPEDAASAGAQAPMGNEVAPVHIERRTVQRCARASSIIMKLSEQNVRQHILLKDTAKEQ